MGEALEAGRRAGNFASREPTSRSSSRATRSSSGKRGVSRWRRMCAGADGVPCPSEARVMPGTNGSAVPSLSRGSRDDATRHDGAAIRAARGLLDRGAVTEPERSSHPRVTSRESRRLDSRSSFRRLVSHRCSPRRRRNGAGAHRHGVRGRRVSRRATPPARPGSRRRPRTPLHTASLHPEGVRALEPSLHLRLAASDAPKPPALRHPDRAGAPATRTLARR